MDDPVAAGLADVTRAQLRFTQQVPGENEYGLVERAGETWLARGTEPLMSVKRIRMAGRHNVMNALAALALGESAGLPLAAMLEALSEFQGLPHRMQHVVTHDGVRWYNDSKGTNVGATLAAIDGIEGKIVLIAGGDGKGADFSPLADAMRRKGAGAVLIGKDAALLEAVLGDVVPVRHAPDMTRAVRQAADKAGRL